jgi:hypothetical protein
MNDKYQIIIQPEAQKAIEVAYFWFSNISHQKASTARRKSKVKNNMA